jgi:hypothetical protein
MFEGGNSGRDDDDRPGVEEIYERATNTSNLKQLAERRTSADVLRDMAMSASRLGAALLRLRGQWESSTQPERQVPRTVKQFLALLGDKEKAIAAHKDECARCDASYENALNALAARIDGLDTVREELTPIAIKWGLGRPADPVTRSERTEKREQDDAMLADLQAKVDAAADDAEKLTAQATLNHWTIEVRSQRAQEEREDRQRAQAKIGAVIRYWLSQTCPKCDGLKFQVLPGTARLSTKMCPPPTQGGCGGTGFAQVPHGQEGRKLANHMDQCAHRYRQQSGARKAISALPLSERIPLGMRHGKNPKPPESGQDPEAD